MEEVGHHGALLGLPGHGHADEAVVRLVLVRGQAVLRRGCQLLLPIDQRRLHQVEALHAPHVAQLGPRLHAGGDLPEDDAHGPHVHLERQPPALHLLRRHVRGAAGDGGGVVLAVGDLARAAKVCYAHRPLDQQHVFCREVAVDDALRMHVCHPHQDLLSDGSLLVKAERRIASDQLLQRPIAQLHHNPEVELLCTSSRKERSNTKKFKNIWVFQPIHDVQLEEKLSHLLRHTLVCVLVFRNLLDSHRLAIPGSAENSAETSAPHDP
mmetsp:Transcript_10591/g.24936  ORF Transcript_10591/g.24936 Transcript_10591/m.24936 type:complete len:267 (+) Transcript_10591:1318-2118(+)